jgi:hypothetical protein
MTDDTTTRQAWGMLLGSIWANIRYLFAGPQNVGW